MTLKEIEALKNVDVRTVDRDGLVDIRELDVRRDIPVEQRIREFVKQVRNPYCFKVGDVVVKSAFSENGDSFEERFERMMSGFR